MIVKKFRKILIATFLLAHKLNTTFRPSIAFVKQEVYPNLYWAPTGSSSADTIFSSIKHPGPIALFTKFNTDFYVVKADDGEKTTELWKEKVTHCKHRDFEYFKTFKYTQQHDFIKDAECIDWDRYDIVIAVDCAVPARVTKRYPQILWAYYISEGCMPSYNSSFKHPIKGYDCFLTQDYHENRKLAEHVIEFPYHLFYYGCFHELFEYAVEPKTKQGINLEFHTDQSLTKEQRRALRSIAPTSRYSGSLKERMAGLMQTKYYVQFLEPRSGKRAAVRGNAVLEGIAGGNLVIARRTGLPNKSVLNANTLVNSFDELLNQLRYFEHNPEAYERELQAQRIKMNKFCFERPMRQLIKHLNKKRTES